MNLKELIENMIDELERAKEIITRNGERDDETDDLFVDINNDLDRIYYIKEETDSILADIVVE